MANKENNQLLEILNHISGIFVGFIGPLIFLLASDEKEVKKHAKAALNWQLSAIVYSIIISIISIILLVVFIGFVIGAVFLTVLYFLNLIFCIIAAIKASEGQVWNYPLTIPFLKV